jgi:hypothetical protein
MLDHPALRHLLGEVPGRVQVQPPYRRPPVRRDLLGRRQELPAGVVDQHVDAAEPLQRQVDQRVRHLRLADVAGQHRAVLADPPSHLLQRLRPAAGDHHPAAVAVQRQRRRPADAGAAAGDDRDAAHRSAR